MIWERLFRWTLRQEIESWEELHLLDAASLERLRAHYGFATSLKDQAQTKSVGLWARWVLYLAIAAFLAGFFSFARGHDIDLGPA